MSASNSSTPYRYFQILALVVGAISLICGQVMSMPELFGAGIALLFHGVVSTILLSAEGVRHRETAVKE